MDLKNFVAETLTQIVAGVSEATTRIAELNTNARVNPMTIRTGPDDAVARRSEVDFDVAITVVEQAETTSKDKIGASVGVLSVVSARLSGEAANEKADQQRNETVSRVRFKVQLAQPSEVEDRREETERRRAHQNATINRSRGLAY